MSGRASRSKGARMEASTVSILQGMGIKAQRVPLSGAAGGMFGGDVLAEIGGKTLRCECKVRGTGFGPIYAWLEGNDLLVIKRDRCEPLVVFPLKRFLEMTGQAP